MFSMAHAGQLYCNKEKGHDGEHAHTVPDVFHCSENADSRLQLYTEACKLAHSRNQVVGGRGDYYVTLEQLELILSRPAH